MRRSFVGTAGWNLGRSARQQFDGEGPQLARYARLLNACEINATFHRLQRASTYQRWAECVPAEFRFSLKAPKQITHQQKLSQCRDLLVQFLEAVRPLTERGTTTLLFQLPPSLAFQSQLADEFFGNLREFWSGRLVCEPRHHSWFEDQLAPFWQAYRIARAAADPATVPAAAWPGGCTDLSYFRWHGSPRMYYSAYTAPALEQLAETARACPGETYCVFDNTAAGEATANALELTTMLT